MAVPEGFRTSGAAEAVEAVEALEGAGAATVEVVDRMLRPVTDHWVRHGWRGVLTRRPDIRMVPGTVRVGGRTVQFAVSDNEDACGPDGPGTPPIWAVNIHGYFAGGGMYWRESARLAERMGWRVVNPSLPGFGGSDALPPTEVSLASVAERVEAVLRHVGAGPVVVLGHSMGGAVAVRQVVDHPRHVLGLVYRAGVGTPAWRQRRGLVATALSPFLPEVAALADMAGAMILDVPDLFMGRILATMRSLMPDLRRNVQNVTRTFPLGAMLMTIDLRPEIRQLARAEVPMLAEWGCFDRMVSPATATEFATVSRTSVQWVPGGHSWMLARPQGQADIFQHVPAGQRFVDRVEERWRAMTRRSAAAHTA